MIGFQEQIVRIPAGAKVTVTEPAIYALKVEVGEAGQPVATIAKVRVALFLEDAERVRALDPLIDGYQWLGVKEEKSSTEEDPCNAHVYWWDGEYEGNCELPEGHDGPHYDGNSWYNDQMEEADPPPWWGAGVIVLEARDEPKQVDS
jgi:hypothetical protein